MTQPFQPGKPTGPSPDAWLQIGSVALRHLQCGCIDANADRMRWSDRKQWVAVILIYAGAVTAGYIMAWLGVPLPWMIGPMVFLQSRSALGRI